MYKILMALAAFCSVAAYANADQVTCIPGQQHFCSFNSGLGKMNCAPIKEKEFNHISRIDIDPNHQVLVLARWTNGKYDISPRKISSFHSPNGMSERTMIVFEHNKFFLSYLHIEKGRFSMYHHLAPFSLHQQVVTGSCN
jgi:hypothetical protein